MSRPRLRVIILSLSLALFLSLALLIGAGILGQHEGPGVISGIAIPADIIASRQSIQRQTSEALRASDVKGTPRASVAKEILFGDFHTHTTLSMDAFMTSLNFAVGEGSHPQADACDFARYCSALDFWSINDHAEFLTPRRWSETVDSIRECNDRAIDQENPDTVAFLGWEWTNIGSTPEDHWGHKNVILKGLYDDQIPTRPIHANPTRATDLLETLNFAARTTMALAFLGDGRVQDFARYAFEGAMTKRCPDNIHVTELPRNCMERAATPAALFRKLGEWGHEALVIPHGNSWGIYTPPGSSWNKQLSRSQHDPALQTLIEVYSGHGNTEEYRSWRGVEFNSIGEINCPAPSPEYTPACWRAGDIIQQRCLEAGETAPECLSRAIVARNNFIAAPQLQGEATIPQTDSQDWLDAGQCRDCFQPPWYHRPANSAQYALALTNFEDPANPLRFKFGFIGSSDVHTARPGTGYKEYSRFYMADFQIPLERPSATPTTPVPPAHSIPFDQVPSPSMFSNDGLIDDRLGAFYQTGGLIAAHTTGRGRDKIWDALDQREVYATSGQRTLLWFDLINGPASQNQVPMGSEVAMAHNPRFRVRAAGSFKQQPGCPDHATRGLSAERLERLCRGECYNPSEERKLITRIEVIRIRPQDYENEPVDALIEDPWRVFECDDNRQGCIAEFDDPSFTTGARDVLYYVRAIEEPSLAVNGAQLDCQYNNEGECTSINPRPASREDDRLAAIEERAWSSPIFVNYAQDPGAYPHTGP
jgi:hypothetical protein